MQLAAPSTSSGLALPRTLERGKTRQDGRFSQSLSRTVAASLAVWRGHRSQRDRWTKLGAMRQEVSQIVEQEIPEVPVKVLVGETPDRGKCLLAAEDVRPGELLLLERAALVHQLNAQVTTEGVEKITAAFEELPKSNQDAIGSLFCPEGLVQSLKNSEGYLEASPEQQKLLGTLKLNSVQLRSAPGAGVFVTLSRANHSCRPSSCFFFHEDMCGLKALRPIQKGEEVTVAYISDEHLLLPIPQRRALLQAWQFECACPRCSAEFDDTRGMRCRCGAVRMARSQGGFGKCQACGIDDGEELRKVASRWWLRYNACTPLAAEEELTSSRWARGGELPKQRRGEAWMKDLVTLHRQLLAAERSAEHSDTPSLCRDGHWMSTSVAMLAAEAHLWRGEYEEAVLAAEARLRYVSQVLGYVDCAVRRGAEA